MTRFLLAYDLGTGGNKASLYDSDGACVAETFSPYATTYPRSGWHEQRPLDWWDALVTTTRRLLAESRAAPQSIAGLGISGHSLGVVPLDRHGNLLREQTPIWSDARASEQARDFFSRVSECEWYNITGNGFPAPLYSVFKVLWYRDHEPDVFRQIYKILGTKDYINFRLTGSMVTDFSYASGSGVYDLLGWDYSPRLVTASGLPRELFPEPLASTAVIGGLTGEAAQELGLAAGTPVVAGGVDNSCMALGARNIAAGRMYNSQGSSSWIAVTSAMPLLDERTRPFVFTHVLPGLFNSALGIFSTGSSFRWVRDRLCADLVERARVEGSDVYDLMVEEAEMSPPGARGLIFHPNLAGGSSLDASMHIRGAFLNLDLGHTRTDLLRAAMEGIALQGRVALDVLRSLALVSQEMIVVGGGGRSRLWRQIHADAYRLRILKTNIDQQAAALGAAALAAVGVGLWPGVARLDDLHQVADVCEPRPEACLEYERILPVFQRAGQFLSGLGDSLQQA